MGALRAGGRMAFWGIWLWDLKGSPLPVRPYSWVVLAPEASS